MKKLKNRIKKTLIYLLICSFVLISYPLMVSASSFSDVPNDYWAKEYIDFVVERGIMSGTTDTTFSPSTNINRGQFALCLSKCLGIILENNINTGFSDVPTNKYYAGAVKWATENSLIDPTTSSTFTPSSAITRAHVANAMAKYSIEYGILMERKALNYIPNDCSSLNAILQTNIQNAIKWGFMSLDANYNFNPNGYVTRAHAAVIFKNLYDYYVTVPISYLDGNDSTKFINYYNNKLYMSWYAVGFGANEYSDAHFSSAMNYYAYSGYAYTPKASSMNTATIQHYKASFSTNTISLWNQYTAGSPEIISAFTIPFNTNGEKVMSSSVNNRNIDYAIILYNPNFQPRYDVAKHNTIAHEVFHTLGFGHISSDIRLSIINYGKDAPELETMTGLQQYDYYALNEHYN